MTCWILTVTYNDAGVTANTRTVYRDVNTLMADVARMKEEQGVTDDQLDIEQAYLVPKTGE